MSTMRARYEINHLVVAQVSVSGKYVIDPTSTSLLSGFTPVRFHPLLAPDSKSPYFDCGVSAQHSGFNLWGGKKTSVVAPEKNI